MEIEVDDLKIGYQEIIRFINLTNNQNIQSNTFRAMATPDGASYVIIYQWSDPMTRTFNDKEEAFYIDNVNENNMEKARSIFVDVYQELNDAYNEDYEQDYNMSELVNNTIKKYNSAKQR